MKIKHEVIGGSDYIKIVNPELRKEVGELRTIIEECIKDKDKRKRARHLLCACICTDRYD